MRNPIQLVVRKVLGEIGGYEVRSMVVRKVLGEIGGYEVRLVDFSFFLNLSINKHVGINFLKIDPKTGYYII